MGAKQSKKKNVYSTTDCKDQQENDAYGFDHYQKRISPNDWQHCNRTARLFRGRSCSYISSSGSSHPFNSTTSDYGIRRKHLIENDISVHHTHRFKNFVKLPEVINIFISGSNEGLNNLNTRSHNTLISDAVPRTNTSHSMDDLSKIYSIQDEFYNMKNSKRGSCLIINIKHAVGSNPRYGTENDVRNLCETFRYLEFDVILHEDSTNMEIEAIIDRCSKENHSNADCFVLVIMSHGREGHICTFDGEMSLNAIFSPIKNCRTLIGKPKFICIQACRGTQIDRGLRVNERRASLYGMHTDSIISPELDVVIAYSTTPDFVSWRNTSRGSIYIEVLCHYLKKEGQRKEITKLLQKVNNTITKAFNDHNFCQVPCYTSSLSKSLVFSMKKKPVTILYDDGTHGPAIGLCYQSYTQ